MSVAKSLQIENAVRRVHDQSTFVKDLLAGALEWPLGASSSVEQIAYEWTAEELRIVGVPATLANGKAFQIALPGSKWGIFVLELENPDVLITGRGMTGLLRRILGALIPKKRSVRSAELAAFQRQDLLFICTHNYERYRFSYFSEPAEKSGLAPMKSFGWGPEDLRAVRTICEFNLQYLVWSSDPDEADAAQSRIWAGAFDVEKVTEKFYEDYASVFAFVETSIATSSKLTGEQLRLFTQSLFNRLMFLRFIERKGWLRFPGQKGDQYLAAIGAADGSRRDSLFSSRLRPLFFDGLAQQGRQTTDAYGAVPFLNGGLFEESELDRKVKAIPDEAFEPLVGADGLFYRYNFTVEESTPLDIDVAVDPEMLGRVFEELVTGRHESGSYYTPRPVVTFMCREALKRCLVEKTHAASGAIARLVDDHVVDGLSEGEAQRVIEVLEGVKAVDPACGSGAYLLGLLQELIAIRRALQSDKLVADPNFVYELKLHIISNNLYGVDIDPFATEIAKLRLWLSLAVDSREPLPLPNLDFKIETGDSLLGADPRELPDLFRIELQEKADQLLILKADYMTARGAAKTAMKNAILAEETAIAASLHSNVGHGVVDWRTQFADVFVSRGGFDLVLANPPYVNMVQMDAHDPKYRDKMRANFTTAKGGFDLFIPFLERGVQLTAKGGMLAYIVPNKLLGAEYATAFRRYLTTHMSLQLLADLSRIPVFSASVYPVIVIAQAIESSPTLDQVAIYRAEALSIDDISLINLGVKPISVTTSAGGRWSPLIDSEGGESLGGAIAGLPTFAQVADVTGAATVSEAYEWKDAVVDNGERLVRKNQERYAAFVVSGNIRPFFHTWATEKVRYLKDSYVMPVLDKQHNAVSKRRVRQIESAKIIVSGMSKRPTCVWDPGGIASGKSTVIAIPKVATDGPFLTAVLNSSAMAKIYTSLFGSLSLAGGYLRFGPPQVKALPVPRCSAKEKATIMALVERCGMADIEERGDLVRRIDEKIGELFGL